MRPHLVRWQTQYERQGFQVVYVADGRRVARATMEERARTDPYLVYYDGTGAAMTAYGIRAYPTAYILDSTGTVIWEGIPHFNPPAVEQAIQAALAR